MGVCNWFGEMFKQDVLETDDETSDLPASSVDANTAAGALTTLAAGGLSWPTGTVTTGSGFNHLSDEEAKELVALEDEYNQQQQQLRREMFKKIPTDLRQKIVDQVMINQQQTAIEEAANAISKTDRQTELEQKKNMFGLGMSIGLSNVHWNADSNKFHDWFDDEEIIDMHNDALAEEILLDVKP